MRPQLKTAKLLSAPSYGKVLAQLPSTERIHALSNNDLYITPEKE
jgi:hypothetical protein